MLKIMSIFLLVFLLEVSASLKECNDDLANVTKYHYLVDNTIKNYKLSTKYAYKALKSCEKHPLYDFNLLYNYIVTNDLRVQNLWELEALKASGV